MASQKTKFMVFPADERLCAVFQRLADRFPEWNGFQFPAADSGGLFGTGDMLHQIIQPLRAVDDGIGMH